MPRLNQFTAPFLTVLFLLIALVVYGAFFGPITLSVNGGDPNRTFTVQGEGKVEVTPDTFTSTFRVEEQGATQSEAQQLGNEKQNQALEELRNLGFEEDKIKTTQYNIREDFDFINGSREEQGYVFTQSTSIEIDSRERMERALDALASIGINIGNVSVEADEEEYRDDARKEAVKDARQKAEELAEAGGFRVGKIASISEGTTPDFPRPLPAQEGRAVEEMDQSIISPGTDAVISTISVTYYIR